MKEFSICRTRAQQKPPYFGVQTPKHGVTDKPLVENPEKTPVKTMNWLIRHRRLGPTPTFSRHSPYTIQIRGNRTTFPPPRELYPLCSHPMA